MGTASAAVKPEPASYQRDINAALVRHLYRQATVAILGGALPASLLLTYMLWNATDRTTLLWWLFAHIGILALRLALIAQYFRRSPPQESAARWASALAALALVSGCSLVVGCALFFDPMQPLTVVTLCVILFALSAGSSVIQGFSLLSFWLTVGPIMSGLVLVLLWHGDPVSRTIALLAVIVSFAYFAAARNARQLHTDFLRVGYENIALRREAEEKTRLLEATLEEMNAARRNAESANAAKTRFLATASHDLRQPIHALGLLLATLADRVRNERTAPLLAQIDDAVQAVDSMLGSLLRIARLEAGVVKARIEPVDLGSLLLRLCNEEEPIAALTGNRLQVRGASTVHIRSDAAMLHRILANLIGNALRYTHHGRVLVGVRRRGETVRIDVIDTGPGIPAESLEEIFLEFRQLGNPERDRRHGLGLGLAIVKRLAQLLDHPLEVRSVVGRGSRFSITVPRSAAPLPATPRTETPVASGRTLHGRRILLLDDEVAVVQAMRQLLEHWGCTVVTGDSPEQAESLLRRPDPLPDLLIVDYRLRGHASGIATIGRLREVAGAPIPALVITGDTAPNRLREAQASGHPLLHKPVMPEQLRRVICELIPPEGDDQREISP